MTMHPHKVGVVIEVDDFQSLTIEQWVTVKWETGLDFVEQFGDTSVVPIEYVELV